LEAEGQCTGELAQDSTFELSSGIATATHSLKDDELVISIEDSDGFFKLVSKGSTPLWSRVPSLIMEIAAPSVAHYGPVVVLRLPVGRPPDDKTARLPAALDADHREA